MNIKIGMLVALFVAALPMGVKAQDAKGYNDYRVGCESGADCSDYNVDYEGTEENTDLAQIRRTRRTRSTSDSKYYAGGNLGVVFLDGDADVGFSLGGLFGYNFTNNIAAELELFNYFAGTETDDLGVNFFGAAANGVYKYPFGSDEKSIYGFAGAGIGIGVVSATGDVSDDLDDAGVDTSESGFLFQGKVGVGYPLSNKLDLTGQLRYVTVSTDSDTGDAFSIEAGARYNF